AFRREGGRAIERGAPLIHDLHALPGETRVLQAQREVAATQAGDNGVLDRWCESLEVGVPDPGDVASVRVPIAQGSEDSRRAPCLEERTDRRVESRRVLHQN